MTEKGEKQETIITRMAIETAIREEKLKEESLTATMREAKETREREQGDL